MPDEQFSHVCTACCTPALSAQRKQYPWNRLILAAATIGGAVVFVDAHSHPTLGTFVVGAGLGFVVAYIGLYSHLRKRARTCASCHSESLIPVASPEGLRVMKELGFVES